VIVGPRYNDEDPAVAAAYALTEDEHDEPEEEPMSEHNHPERVDGCFRCDLSADEPRATDYTPETLEKGARALQPGVFNPAVNGEWTEEHREFKQFRATEQARAVLDAVAGEIAARALEDWIAGWPTEPGDGTFLTDVARDGMARAARLREGGA
jgi:hypothetical protein